MIILNNFTILYFLIFNFVNSSEVNNNNDNDINNESIKLHVAALRDQATNLVNQINLMIGSHMNLLPTSTTPYFSTEASVTFLVRPHITDLTNNNNNDSMGTKPGNPADTNLPTPTDFAASRSSNTQTSNASRPSASTTTQTSNSLPTSTPNSNPTPTTSQSDTSSTLLPTSTMLSTIDLFPLNPPSSIPRHYSIGPDKGNNTVKTETLQVKSLSLASGKVIRMKLENWCLLVALTIPIILI